MNFPALDFSTKKQRTIIFAVTIGNLLEWYEIYLYVYWAPIISKLFFNTDSELIGLTNTFLLFAMGFIARPIGGIFFGRLGDSIGRKKALVLSIITMTFPTFVTGLLPSYAEIGAFAPVLLALMRILQSFPAGGELPGAACYLYESANFRKRRYFSSWASLGYQIGIIVSMIECFFLEKFLSPEALMTWGWRISFIFGGLIGLCGLYLRYKLHETPLYREMHTHEKIVKEPLLGVLSKHKKGILLGMLFCLLNSSAFYIFSIVFPIYFGTILETSYSDNLFSSLAFLLLITIPLPFFGMLGDKFSNKAMVIGATLGIILLLYPMYLSFAHASFLFMSITALAFSLFFTCLSALLPYLICDLFPTHVRFTCVGLSFNLVDGIIGGFSPFLALYLFKITGSEACFYWLLLICALISLSSYLKLKEGKHGS